MLDEPSIATLNINEELDAGGMDELISRLGELRASMLPEVPKTRPKIGSGKMVAVESEPELKLIPLENGGARLWIRSQGFNWLAFDLGAEKLDHIRHIVNLLESTDLIAQRNLNRNTH